MSDDDWANIPEALDYSRQNKFISRVRDKATPMPDSIIQSASASSAQVAMLGAFVFILSSQCLLILCVTLL